MADSAAGGKRSEEDKQRSEVREFVNALFSQVSEEDRILLTLKEVEGLSLKELEQVYNAKRECPEGEAFSGQAAGAEGL